MWLSLIGAAVLGLGLIGTAISCNLFRTGFAKHFFEDRRGNVVIMAAFAIPVMVGAALFALDFGRALSTRVERQSAADLTAYAGALAYQQTGSEDAM